MTDALYREHILDHARHPRNKGALTHATHTAREVNASCGDVCLFSLRLEAHDAKHEVTAASFDGHGCALSTAAASLLTEEVEGRAAEEIVAMTDEAFLSVLGVQVTSGRRDCALLPLRAMRKALRK